MKAKVKNGLLGGALLVLGGLGGQGIEYGVEHWQYLPPERIPLELNVIATEMEDLGGSTLLKSAEDNPFAEILVAKKLGEIAGRIRDISERLETVIEKQKE